MISYLKGNIVEKDFGRIILDVNNVGYRVNITLHTYMNINKNDKSVLIYIYFHHWQDGQELYGFIDKDERNVYKKIISVSGVGPKLANKILQNVEYNLFTKMISEGNVTGLTKINGLGKKTAEKLIFELKDKFIKAFPEITSESSPSDMSKYETAVNALVSLGYKEKPSKDVITELFKENKDISIENLIKQALLLLYEKK